MQKIKIKNLNKRRAVSFAEGEALAKELRCEFYESSIMMKPEEISDIFRSSIERKVKELDVNIEMGYNY